MKNPTCAFLLCTNKFDQYLPLAVESVLQQTDKDFRFYIIANNCTEDLWAYLNSLKDNRLRLHRTNLGQLCFNLNYGINIIKEDYILRFDADDICYPERLSLTKKKLKELDYPAVLSGTSDLIDESGNIMIDNTYPEFLDSNKIKSLLWRKNPICHPATAIKRDVLTKAGGYSWGFNSEDYDLWLRLARSESVRMFKIPEKMIQYRISEQQSRGSLLPYAECSGMLLREFIMTKRCVYLFGFLLSLIKVIKSKKNGQ